MTKIITGTGREYDKNMELTEFEERMNFIHKDMGYETKEEFEKVYTHDKYPVSLTDIEHLKMSIGKELVSVWEFHRKENTPVSFSHV